MTKQHICLKRIRLVYRPGKTLVKTALLSVIVLSTVTLFALGKSIQDTRAGTAAMKTQAALLEQENNALTQDIAELGSEDSIRDIAKEELGLVDPDTVVFIPGNR